jgi:transcriptional regulator MftR-like protein
MIGHRLCQHRGANAVDPDAARQLDRCGFHKPFNIDRLLQSTEALRARKQAIFVQMEETVFGAMCELWPQPKRRATLRLVAMVSMGVMRVAMEGWRQDGGKRRLTKYLQENFAALEAEI